MTRPRPFRALLLPAILGVAANGDGALAQSDAAPELVVEPYVFETRNAGSVEAEHAFITMPENRSDPGSRRIELHFVRFASTAEDPGAPIVLLSGGPGSSGVDFVRGPMFPIFMAMRELGDVIALDQRDTGWSSVIPECKTDYRIPIAERFEIERAAALMRAAAEECAARWRSDGIDLAGYTAVESARDIDDLRRVLGAEKVSLWGISWGGRLALTALREMPGRIDRVVLLSPEALQATYRLPGSYDALVARYQQLIDADADAAAAYPDLAGLMRRVHEQLEAEPLELTVADEAGGETSFTFGAWEMQALISGGIRDPGSAALLPMAYATMAEGAPPMAPLLPRMLGLRRGFDPIVMEGRSAMDLTAGVSEAHLARIREQAGAAILGDPQAFELGLLDALGLDDLGEDYRAPVESDVPVLVFSGTLDGASDPADVAEGLRGLSNLSLVVVENGGHTSYLGDPAIVEATLAFLRGEEVSESVTLAPPSFATQAPQ